MNKEEILQMLKLLREKLPSEALIGDENSKSEFYDDLARKAVLANDKLKKTIDLEDITSEEIERISRELEDVNDELEIQRNELTSQGYTKRLYESDSFREYNKAQILQRRYGKETDEKKKLDIKNELDEAKKASKDNRDWALETEESIVKIRDEISRLESSRRRLEKRLETERELEKENYVSRYESKVAQRTKEADMLRGKLGYLNINGILDSLIDDYENDRTNEEEVNYRMHILKGQLQDENIRNMLNLLSAEQRGLINDQISSMEDERNTLRSKLYDDISYIMSEEEYNNNLSELNRSLEKATRKYENANRRLDDTESKLDSLRSSGNLEGHSKDVIEKETKRLERVWDKQNKDVQDRLNELKEIRRKINALDNSYGKVDEVQKNYDINRLKELDNQIRENKYFNVLDPLSIDERIDKIIDATKEVEDVYDNSSKPLEKSNLDEEQKPNDEHKAEEEHKLEEEQKPDVSVEPVFPKLSNDDLDIGLDPSKDPNLIKDIRDPKPNLLAKLKKIWNRAKAWILGAIALAGVAGAGTMIYKHMEENKTDDLDKVDKVIEDTTKEIDLTQKTLEELNDLINKCKAVDPVDYTDESYSKMLTKLNEVETLLNNGLLDNDGAKKQKDELQNAYDGLVKKDEVKETPNPLPTPTTPVTSNTPNTPSPVPSEDVVKLKPGESVENEFGSVDYDGVQRDKDGNVIGNAEVDKDKDGYAVIGDDDMVKQTPTPTPTVTPSNEPSIEWDWDALLNSFEAENEGMTLK